MNDMRAHFDLNINLKEYRNKVLGCWTGKNIGGTLGAPMEGAREMHNVKFYIQDLKNKPVPNDDLDLQLVWLQAVEENGVSRITPRLLGEYWLDLITGPWNEYGVCKTNIRHGFYPPLSGSCNNDTWKYSNGAWIRSEIWACLFPGEPDRAAELASRDACADHCGEGIYAEMFTAAMESSAFVIGDIDKIIQVGLSKIPEDCRVARSVNVVINSYKSRKTWVEAREAVVKDNKDLGWFQAPMNIAFLVIGLLYGEGDFGKTICTAVNCGDDTDCTGATSGAILGIINGRSGIPTKWTDPIGDTIETIAINPFPANIKIPGTLDELTDRVINAALVARASDPTLIRLSHHPTHISEEYLKSYYISDWVKERVWTRSPYELTFELPYGELIVDYVGGPVVSPGEKKRVNMKFHSSRYGSDTVTLKWHFPEGWQILPGQAFSLRKFSCELECTIVPANFEDAYCYVPLEVKLSGRFNPITLTVPFQLSGAVRYNTTGYPPEYADRLNKVRAQQVIKPPLE
jgi:ADP-ribosylglycohydrolase